MQEREPAEDAGPPYWNMYFPGENYYDVFVRSRTNRLFIEAFQKYFTEERQLYESSQQTPSKQDDTVKKVHPEMGDSGEWIVRLDYTQLCVTFLPVILTCNSNSKSQVETHTIHENWYVFRTN